MARASVQRTLADGEAQALPPLLVVQPGADRNVPQEMTLDLLREYQRAGGALQYLFYPGLPHAFAYQPSPETDRLLEDVWPFVALPLPRGRVGAALVAARGDGTPGTGSSQSQGVQQLLQGSIMSGDSAQVVHAEPIGRLRYGGWFAVLGPSLPQLRQGVSRRDLSLVLAWA